MADRNEGAGAVRYGAMAQALHWGMAALILGAFALILAVEASPPGPGRGALMALHKSFGVTAIALVGWRLAWRFLVPPPPLPAGIPARVALAARVGHAGLYALMALVPAAGLALSWAAGRDVVVFGLVTLPALLGAAPDLRPAVGTLHVALGYGLIGLVAVHALAAAWHQWVIKDGVLVRMLPRVPGIRRP